MKYVMVIVWMLQGGGLQGSPWKYFDSLEECGNYIEEQQKAAWDDRFIFASGCLERETMKTFRSFHFQLTPGMLRSSPK